MHSYYYHIRFEIYPRSHPITAAAIAEDGLLLDDYCIPPPSTDSFSTSLPDHAFHRAIQAAERKTRSTEESSSENRLPALKANEKIKKGSSPSTSHSKLAPVPPTPSKL